MLEIREGRCADYEQLMDRVALSFREGNPGHFRFEDLYPDTVRCDSECMAEWSLVVENGDLVAGLQVVPRPMVAAGNEVRVAGLGNVFCCPSQRGRGYMSRLLQRAIERMAGDGCSLSMLGGDRTRYGHFGWEHAGSSRSLNLSKQVKRHDSDIYRFTAEILREWRGEQQDNDRMFAVYNELPYRLKTDAGRFVEMLKRPGHVVWLCDTSDTGFGYAVIRGRTVLEYAGSIEAVRALIAFFLSSGDCSVTVPPAFAATEHEAWLLENSRSFSVVPTGMLNVISLQALLESYRGLLRQRLDGWRGSLSMMCPDTGDTVFLESDGDAVNIQSGTGAEADLVIRLKRNQFPPLLFGPFPTAFPDGSGEFLVRRLFPLPIHWPALAHV